MSNSDRVPEKITSSRRAAWPAYAAAAWAFLFAAMSFYWALGGMAGVETLGSAFTDPAVTGDPAFTAFVWITAFLKAGLGLIALSLVQAWGRAIPRRWRLVAARIAGIVLTLYGAALLVQHGFMAAGASDIAASIGSAEALRWHLFLWDPFWLLGGLLFLAAARQAA